METLIAKTAGLQIGYDRLPLFSGPLTLAIPSGRSVALIGPNGSGKSTLLAALVGENRPLAGEVRIDESPVAKLSPSELARLVAYVPQEPVFPPHLSVVETLKTAFLSEMGFFSPISAASLARVEQALEIFSLGRLRNKPMGAVSAGERQRTFLARAFLQPARLIALDEPTNHLDPQATHVFAEGLKRARAVENKSIIFATHDLDLVEKTAEWAIALRNGGVFFQGPIEPAGVRKLFSEVFF